MSRPVPGPAWPAPITACPWAPTSTPPRCTGCPPAAGELADLIWEAPADLAAGHGQLFQAALRAYNAGNSGRAQQLWDKAQAIWSQAWAANHAALELVQHAGLTRFSPLKPQRWVVASFEHHCGPHGLPQPHVHNIVLTDLTTGPSAPA